MMLVRSPRGGGVRHLRLEDGTSGQTINQETVSIRKRLTARSTLVMPTSLMRRKRSKSVSRKQKMSYLRVSSLH
jgi:hypothetical protein